MALIRKDKKEQLKKAIEQGDTNIIKSVKNALPLEDKLEVKKEEKTAPVQTGPSRMDRSEMEKMLEVFKKCPSGRYGDAFHDWGKSDIGRAHGAIDLIGTLKTGGYFYRTGVDITVPKIGDMHPDDQVEVMQGALGAHTGEVVHQAIEITLSLPPEIGKRLANELADKISGVTNDEKMFSLLLPYLDIASPQTKAGVIHSMFYHEYVVPGKYPDAVVGALWPRFLGLPVEEKARIVADLVTNSASEPVRNAGKYMIQATINEQNAAGEYLIAFAGRSFGLDMVKELLAKYGADINYQNAEGLTALMAAIDDGSPSHVEFLLSKKPELGRRDKNGMSALDHALHHAAIYTHPSRGPKIADMVKKAGAK